MLVVCSVFIFDTCLVFVYKCADFYYFIFYSAKVILCPFYRFYTIFLIILLVCGTLRYTLNSVRQDRKKKHLFDVSIFLIVGGVLLTLCGFLLCKGSYPDYLLFVMPIISN